MEPLIDVKHLVKNFGDLVAVDDLSFSVFQGDVYGFLGQNGAGKSTTLRMILSLILPSSGTIRLFGQELSTNRKSVLKRVGAVIERPDLYKYLSAIENLSIFARMSGRKATSRQLIEQLEMVGLADRAKSKVATYSQGMKQRLGIAVALVHNPDLVILDEPTNGLDPQGIADMRNLILHLSKDLHKTVVVSSHLLNEIEQIASRMIILDKGKKMVEGTVADFFQPAKNKVHLVVSDPQKAKLMLAQTPWLLEAEQLKQELVLSLPPDQVPALNRFLVQQEIDILSIRSVNSLEDYFLSLTSENQHVATFTN
ncbi:ABC transporter ATP-binding protein [Flavihumibacter sp. UBA7668]|uniref:ABC transporter ATP-binding protein n=1 Tax=Flavihumibacter sp. UBA7668 TaxID=1946542 RepID=UPI0025C341F3|nr:ABC transporter ATP-binding protein [Flavihumibacter sp. UBA7668]